MFDAPIITPVSKNAERPYWSVMIPTYNGSRYLQKALESVLSQDQGAEQMQIEVIDDCSVADDPEQLVEKVGNGRISFYRNQNNCGAISNFNVCVERSRGQFVHILHQDDFILPGFYDRIARAATQWPNVALYATRAFIIDEDGNNIYTTARIPALETPSKDVTAFFYATPILTPAVVVRRDAYERFGGFRPEFPLVADCEMWIRLIDNGEGVVCPDVLAYYRSSASTETSRLTRSGEGLRDTARFNKLLASKYPTFDARLGARRIYTTAYEQAKRFEKLGDDDAAAANWQVWRDRFSFKVQFLHSFWVCIRELRIFASLTYRYLRVWLTLSRKGKSVER